MAKKKRKPKTKTETECFPSKPLKHTAEHRVVIPDLLDKTIFDPCFPKKKEPFKQVIIDTQRIYKTEDLKTFVGALKDIVPFWIKHTRSLTFYRNIAQRLVFDIVQRSEPLRAEHNKKHDNNIRPMPNDLFLMPSWITDAEMTWQKNQPDNTELSKIKIASQLMLQNPKITGPKELTSKVNKALKGQGRKTTYLYIKNTVWPKVKPKK